MVTEDRGMVVINVFVWSSYTTTTFKFRIQESYIFFTIEIVHVVGDLH